jgi:hypothetical protein
MEDDRQGGQSVWTASVRRIICLSCAIGALAPATEAQILGAECAGPSLFPDTTVNVVVLPYESAPSFAAVAARITGLMQLQALAHVASLGNVGVIHGLPTSPVFEACPSDVVAQSMRRKATQRDRSAGQGLVIVSGRAFEDDAAVYVQTRIAFQRRGVRREAMTLKIGEQSFSGRLSSQTIALSPAKISLAELDTWEADLRGLAVLRQSAVRQQRPVGSGPPTLPLRTTSDPASGSWRCWKRSSATCGFARTRRRARPDRRCGAG